MQNVVNFRKDFAGYFAINIKSRRVGNFRVGKGGFFMDAKISWVLGFCELFLGPDSRSQLSQ